MWTPPHLNIAIAIFRVKETRHKPSFQLLEDLLLDDLKRKYAGGRLLKYSVSDKATIISNSLVPKKQLSGTAIAAVILNKPKMCSLWHEQLNAKISQNRDTSTARNPLHESNLLVVTLEAKPYGCNQDLEYL